LDRVSPGRAGITVGRGSFIESSPLFGFDLDHHEALFAEKLELLRTLRDPTHVHWAGQHRATLSRQGVFARRYSIRCRCGLASAGRRSHPSASAPSACG
jgi:alkanesulfonate monooxygenase SsuD/methylene tetrahydromethanopterin reductase-like flavin-dependent oxidoreductase (luciferase family)